MGQVGDAVFLSVFQGDAEGIISTQGKADDIKMALSAQTTYVLHGSESFRKQGAVEETFIQVMRFSMIPEIETENIKTLPEKETRRGEDIRGIDAPLPAVNKGDQTAAVIFRLP